MKVITLLKKEIQTRVLFQHALLSFAPKLGQSYLLPEGVWLKMWPAFGKRVVVLVFFFIPHSRTVMFHNYQQHLSFPLLVMIISNYLALLVITRPEESYRLWCVVVCDLETSWMRRPWPTGGCHSRNKQKPLLVMIILNYLLRRLWRIFFISTDRHSLTNRASRNATFHEDSSSLLNSWL